MGRKTAVKMFRNCARVTLEGAGIIVRPLELRIIAFAQAVGTGSDRAT
jgi:hypothetical protein